MVELYNVTNSQTSLHSKIKRNLQTLPKIIKFFYFMKSLAMYFLRKFLSLTNTSRNQHNHINATFFKGARTNNKKTQLDKLNNWHSTFLIINSIHAGWDVFLKIFMFYFLFISRSEKCSEIFKTIKKICRRASQSFHSSYN